MISYEEALRLIAIEMCDSRSHTVEWHTALGQISANDIQSPRQIPFFDNSAMDGFAVNSASTTGALRDNPIRIKVVGCIAAGDLIETRDGNMAVEIMTGARMPPTHDAIIPVERVRVLRDDTGQAKEIEVTTEVTAGENVRYRGEDFQSGQLIAPRGARLHAAHISAMAAVGIREIDIVEAPIVEIITTGKEVSNSYLSPLTDSEIYDANTPYLLSALQCAGIPSRSAGNIGDSEEAFVELLNRKTNARIIISSGAVSKGRWDFIPRQLERIGARIVFHGVGIKPGKPILFAVLADGRFFFGLPGNPVSAAVGLTFFVQPLIARLMNIPTRRPMFAKLTHDFEKRDSLRQFLKARIDCDHEGQQHVSILDGQQSFKISPMLSMNSWAVIREDQKSIAKGASITVAPMDMFPVLP